MRRNHSNPDIVMENLNIGNSTRQLHRWRGMTIRFKKVKKKEADNNRLDLEVEQSGMHIP